MLQENEDIELFLNNIQSKRKDMGLQQPFLLCQGSETNPKGFILIIEDTIVYCGTKCLSAFQNLFASFFIFRCHYPVPLRPFYRFFEEAVFKLSSPCPSSIDFIRTLDAM